MAKKRRKIKQIKKQQLYVVLIVLVMFVLVIIANPSIRNRVRGIFTNHSVPGISLSESKKDMSEFAVFGLDVSQYQHVVVWDKLKSTHDLEFVFIRATAGIDLRDNFFTYNWRSASENELIRGAYHYYRPNENSIDQAENFIHNVDLQPGDLPPVLDIEDYSNIQSLSRLKTGLLKWLQMVEAHYGVKPIIYTYYKYYEAHFKDDARFDEYPIWLARYGHAKHFNAPGDNWLFWQYTQHGKLDGVEGDVDLNVFYRDLESLKSLCVE
ncbi:MAG: GH25 family lysozyme [Bacteroidales bacterium]|jgi:lysozyme|nr:GH25 family lysozyme [Bacteroidales bacterium]